MANYQSRHSGPVIDLAVTRALEAILVSTSDISNAAWVAQNIPLIDESGRVPSSSAILSHLNTHYEAILNNPLTDGEVLHSEINGNRYWAPLGSSLVHNNLSQRDQPNAHPISAISSLEYALSERFLKSEHIITTTGPGDRDKPVRLNAQGKLDPSLMDVGLFHFVSEWTPVAGTEYPDISGETPGAMWMISGVDPINGYTFQGGDLAGRTAFDGDTIIWSNQWSLMKGSMNPAQYYRIDGSNPINADFQANGFLLSQVGAGVTASDGINKGQMDAELALKLGISAQAADSAKLLNFVPIVESLGSADAGKPIILDANGMISSSMLAPTTEAIWGSITGTLSDQTDLQLALDGKAEVIHGHVIVDIVGLQDALDEKALLVHTHHEGDITDLDKYTQAEVDGLLNAKEDILGVPDVDGKILSSLINGTRSWVLSNDHLHNQYLGINAKAADSELLDGKDAVDFESALGVPTTNGFVLSSTSLGERSWIPLPALVWGSITGTLSNQDDLQAVLDDKASISHNHDGDYLAINGKAVDSALLNGEPRTQFVSTAAPDPGQGVDGDVWYQV